MALSTTSPIKVPLKSANPDSHYFPADSSDLRFDRGIRRTSSSARSTKLKAQPKDIDPAVSSLLYATTIPRRGSKRRSSSNKSDNGISVDPEVGKTTSCITSTNSSPSIITLSSTNTDVHKPKPTDPLYSYKSSDHLFINDSDNLFEYDWSNSYSSSISSSLSFQSNPNSNQKSTGATNESSASNSPIGTSLPSTKRRKESIKLSANDDHPLSDSDSDDYDDHYLEKPADQNDKPDSSSSTITTSLPSKKISIVSNLTASLKALTSVASSLSSSQQNFLNSTSGVGVLSFHPRATDEPLPSKLHYGRSPFVHSLSASKSNIIYSGETAVPEIPLETYHFESTLIRTREPRMNPDFLRIYALESVMRKNGKLDAQAPGRAQMILPPRRDLPRSFKRDSLPLDRL